MRAPFRKLPNKEELQEVFSYDPETGLLLRKTRNKGLVETGFKRFRRKNEPWMICVSCKSIQYPAHRIVWKLMTGDDPAPLTIDHIDRNPFNNKWKNLRLADSFVQSQNREWKATMGHKGVTFHKVTQKWQARKNVKGKRIYLGVYETKEEAIKALSKA